MSIGFWAYEWSLSASPLQDIFQYTVNLRELAGCYGIILLIDLTSFDTLAYSFYLILFPWKDLAASKYFSISNESVMQSFKNFPLGAVGSTSFFSSSTWSHPEWSRISPQERECWHSLGEYWSFMSVGNLSHKRGVWVLKRLGGCLLVSQLS